MRQLGICVPLVLKYWRMARRVPLKLFELRKAFWMGWRESLFYSFIRKVFSTKSETTCK